jgi:hypothetical protein
MRNKFNRAYDMGDVTKDMLLCIGHLSALRDFPHLQSIIARDLSASTLDNPFKFSQSQSYIVSEEKLRQSKIGHAPRHLAAASCIAFLTFYILSGQFPTLQTGLIVKI